MENITQFLPFLIPIIVIELGLAITALIHVLRHPHYKIGNKPMWIVIVCFLQIIGPIVYFALGRGDEE